MSPTIDNDTFLLAQETLRYDPELGQFFWRLRRGNQLPGYRAGYFDSGTDWRIIMLDGINIYEHQLAWMLHYKEHPPVRIYHLDGNKSNNKISNLSAKSSYRRATQKNNKSGHPGVSYSKAKKRWLAVINIDRKRTVLGYYKTKSEAVAVRQAAEKQQLQGPKE